MPQDDAVPQAGPTCPLSDEELVEAAVSDRITNPAQTVFLRDLALAVVAAERARLREAIKDFAAECEFDNACAQVDATTRRA